MGSVHQAACECGYSADVTVGGGRRDFQKNSHFPFYCHHCGLVAVNIADLPPDCVTTTCPNCGDPGAVQYGVPPISTHDTRQKTMPASRLALQWGSREAATADHICPACHKMTLKFNDMPDMLFD